MKSIKKFWKFLGAGLISGASDDDAAAITTYAIAGTRLGFSSLWTAFFTFPLMTVIQEMSARIGMVTKKGLAGVIKEHYSPWLLGIIVIIMTLTNILNIGADLSGMSAATNLLIPFIPVRAFDLIYSFIIIILVIFLDFKKIIKYFKWLAMTLIFYILTSLMVSYNWPSVFQKIISPDLTFNSETISIIIAIFGTTLAPYMFFWQTNQEAFQEKNSHHNHGFHNDHKLNNEISHMKKDVAFGMFFSNLIMFFIIVLAATLFFGTEVQIKTIDELSSLLNPLLGEFGQLIFTLGIVGTSFLVIPILAAGSAYILSETFGWRTGLEKEFRKAKPFYFVIIISTVLAIFLNYFGFNPVDLLFYTAFFHGLVLPLLILTILLISNNKKIMGSNINGGLSNTLGVLALIFMTAAVILFFAL